MLFHLPIRYQDRTRISAIGSIQPGSDVVIVGQIEVADVQFGRRRSLLVKVSDTTGLITLRFFHFNQSQQKAFARGKWIKCFGEARRGPRSLEMVHPEYRITNEQPETNLETSLTPVYPATEGVGPNVIRKLAAQSLTLALPDLAELIPPAVCEQFSLPPLKQALQTAHTPPADIDTATLVAHKHPSLQRLALEEMVAHHLALFQLRQQRVTAVAPKFSLNRRSWEKLKPLLGFQLTNAQLRVIEETATDISQAIPALRMIQGDVGSGKTVVAAAAALQAIDAGFQAALMAPTELLAEQHRKNFSGWFEKIGVQVEWLTGKLPAAERRKALANISNGSAQMVVGTHALFQEQVDFAQLGLVIVDEQHRFGVDQRLALRNKGNKKNQVPHQLIMSATPIPRSLAMVFYADLDVSSIDELPPGRKAVNTVVLPDTRREDIVERIRHVCAEGQQVYWVCPLIEESDTLQAQAATDTWGSLEQALPELNVALVHGKMKGKEKDSVMQKFRDAKSNVLVATTVIEVGVDVPNANLMIIENAERLGLAQLHQLRGRVGRGAEQANCVLLYKPPLGRLAKDRLALLRDSNDGFEIAQKDLEHRGPGEMLGTRQTGLQQMRIADLGRDIGLLPKVEQIAEQLKQHHPESVPLLIQRWIRQNDIYANV